MYKRQFPNSIEHIIAVFAIWKTGACYMPMSYKAAESEIREACDTIHPNAAFAECKIPGLKFCLSADEIYEAMEGRSKEMPSDRLANPNMISLSGGTSGKTVSYTHLDVYKRQVSVPSRSSARI